MMVSKSLAAAVAACFLFFAEEALADNEQSVGIEKPHPQPVFPTACVKFAVFDNPHCWGNPKQVVKYPTYEHPGHSLCFADPTHPWASLGDQYCDTFRELYHFEFYPLNGKCEGDPIKLDIPTDGKCKLGIKVYECKVAPIFPCAASDADWADLVTAMQHNWELLESDGSHIE